MLVEQSHCIADREPVYLCLLGGFEVRFRDTTSTLPLSSQRLVGFLAVHGRSVRRIYAAGVLWPDATESHSIGSLRSALWRIGTRGFRLVEADSETMRLASEVRVDLQDVVDRSRRLIRGGGLEDEDLVAVAAARDLLPEQYDDWVAIERERVRQLRLHALDILCERLSALGRHAEAIEAGLAAVSGEPLRESAQMALIKAHLAEGNQYEALRLYHNYQRVLQRELGLEPSAAIRSLLPTTNPAKAAHNPGSNLLKVTAG